MQPSFEPEASYTRIDLEHLRLTSRSTRSYTANDVPSCAAWLLSRRYTEEPARSMTEYGRYRKAARLVVLYHSGSVSCQGDDFEGTMKELSLLADAGGRP